MYQVVAWWSWGKGRKGESAVSRHILSESCYLAPWSQKGSFSPFFAASFSLILILLIETSEERLTGVELGAQNPHVGVDSPVFRISLMCVLTGLRELTADDAGLPLGSDGICSFKLEIH
uniref:Uncharacterized protein n=1 Tax=Grammatophora oceanica TaxID=210454 RepID=A0A7S1URJ6_9STRA|mmetsp:Transcript_15313/g.22456  ORF Transcript_15313/g.22456 Transcript_15313/m.22456 type:complete len:119 (+) Transcript_15313:189-545(+)